MNDSDLNNKTFENNGYTVTPEGGFYTKAKEDIIQDDLNNEAPYKTEPVVETPPEPNYYQYNGYTYSPKPNKPKKSYGAGTVILASLLAAVIGTLGGIFAVRFIQKNNNDDNNNILIDTPPTVSSQNVNINVDKTAENIVEAVYEKAAPSVIGIRTTTSVTSFFGGRNDVPSEGSGVIYTSDGYIITNYHVISEAVTNKKATKLEVFIDDTSKSYSATVVGYNISSDLAVIKINAKGLPAVTLADSSTLKVGQYVITIGNPSGLEFMDSVTYGIISGLDRVVSTNSDVKLIQTDAAINPGNSGGALLNSKGELVGINSLKIVSEEYEGMGFAIPSNTVKSICDKIIERENDPEPYVGISISEKYSASVLEYYGFPVGAVVLSVADGSPAQEAGIARGDIITEYNGKEISNYTLLEQYVNESAPGEKVTIKLYRSGRNYTTTLTVGSNNSVK